MDSKLGPRAPFRLPGGLAWAALCLFGVGCGPRGPSAEVEKARQSLQVNAPQAAYDQLVSEESGEAHYLKAVALNRLKLRKASHEQIRKALDEDPDNPKYQGFEWLLDLLEGTPGAANKIITLYDRNRSSGAIALYATLAYLTKKDVKQSVAAFNAALTMSADAPEHMFEMLNHALNTGRISDAEVMFERLEKARPDDVAFLRELLELAVRRRVPKASESLLARLETLAPNDREIEKLRVEVLLLTEHKEQAVQAAGTVYRRDEKDLLAAEVYARALSQAESAPERDRIFAGLREKFPNSIEILAKYALYLTRSERLPDALKGIDAGLRQTLIPTSRSYLIQVAIGLPLDSEQADLAQQQLDRYRPQLQDPYLVTYYEGRILAIRKEYDAALGKFRKVLEAQKTKPDVNSLLILDAQQQLQRVFAAKALAAAIMEDPPEKKGPPAAPRPKDAQPKGPPSGTPAKLKSESAPAAPGKD